MAHRMSKKEVRQKRDELDFRMQALRLARKTLLKAIEWLDVEDSDMTWALVNARSAVKLLEVAKEI
jgi:hypothetical protein